MPLQMPDLADLDAVARWRAETNALWGTDDDPEVPHRPVTIGGVPCLVAGPQASDSKPTVVYAHGGGYVLGSAAVAIPITARLGRILRLVSVDFRQPPEHTFPAALDDMLAVYRALAGYRASVALAGDSAGGALALSAAVIAAADGMPPVLVQAAVGEPLASQAREFQQRAAGAGVDITLDLWEGLWHTWHYHALPEADQALAEAAAFLAASLNRADGP